MWALKSFRPIASNRSILIQASRTDWGIHLVYTGSSLEALRDAGCITTEMFASLQVRHRGKTRRDANGNLY